jgi:DNA-binding Lrp family transcriptional regulator
LNAKGISGQRRLDKLDASIVREMMRGNIQDRMLLRSLSLRSSFRTIGRTLGVDEGTVRNRVRKLKEAGVIMGWRIEINPALFGRTLRCVNFDVVPERDKHEVIAAIHSVDNVTLICNYLGPGLFVMISGDNERSLRETSRRIAEIAGREEFEWTWRPTSAPRSELTMSDWEIIRSLQRDPWKPYNQIADEVHLSSKTTKKRMTRLAEEGAIQLSMDVNMAALKGIVPGALWVFYITPADREKVVKLVTGYLGEELFFASLDDRHCGYFGLSLPSAARLEAIGEWVRRQPGVKSCRGGIVLGVIPGRVKAEQDVERKITAAVTSRSR